MRNCQHLLRFKAGDFELFTIAQTSDDLAALDLVALLDQNFVYLAAGLEGQVNFLVRHQATFGDDLDIRHHNGDIRSSRFFSGLTTRESRERIAGGDQDPTQQKDGHEQY